jgi:hypothetical protein
MSDIISFANLAPGLYQIASPDEIKTISAEVVLREADHFWLESKNRKKGKDDSGKDIWESVPINLHTGTAGLLIQAEHIGARAVSRVVELDRQRIRVIATGWCLGSDGLLEVIEKSKEYDMAAELMKAALKETNRVTDGKPDAAQSTALVKTATEESALALVAALPSWSKAKIMEGRLEVQTHREALCRTKSENMALRVFVQKRGGILKAKPGIGEIRITLAKHVLMRKLDSGAVRQATEALYGPTPPQPTNPNPAAEPDEPGTEEAEIIEAEVTDASESEAPAEDGFPTDEPESGEGAGDHTGPLTVPEAAQQSATSDYHCDLCKADVTAAIAAYCHGERGSQEFGGAVLCFKCQQAARKGGGQ